MDRGVMVTMLVYFDYLVVVAAAVVAVVVAVAVVEVVVPDGFVVVVGASYFVFVPQVARHPYLCTYPYVASFDEPKTETDKDV
jgi:hypothetical protein